MTKSLTRLLNNRKQEGFGTNRHRSEFVQLQCPTGKDRQVSSTCVDYQCEDAKIIDDFNNDILTQNGWNMVRNKIIKRKRISQLIPVIHNSEEQVREIEDTT